MTQTDPQSPAPAQPLHPVPHGGFPAWAVGLIYFLLPSLTVGAIYFSLMGHLAAFLGGWAVAAAYSVAFSRANPRWIGIELIAALVGTYYVVSIYAVLWIAAAALAGGAGAWLTKRGEGEDDHFFIPAFVSLIAYIVLLWFGLGATWQPAADRAGMIVAEWRMEMDRELARLEAQGGRSVLTAENWEAMKADFGVISMGAFYGLWVVGLWLTGRAARRAARLLKAPGGLLILFRLGERYIFLLIAGLVFAILGGLYDWWGCVLAALPIFVTVSIAAFIEGLAVILFHGTLRRKLGRPGSGTIVKVFGMLAIFLQPVIGVILGLADHWFDFRRIQTMRRTQT